MRLYSEAIFASSSLMKSEAYREKNTSPNNVEGWYSLHDCLSKLQECRSSSLFRQLLRRLWFVVVVFVVLLRLCHISALRFANWNMVKQEIFFTPETAKVRGESAKLISLINITVRVVVEFIEKVPILIFFLSYCRKIFRCWGVKTQTHVGSLLRNEYICLQNCKKFFVPTMRESC